MKALLLALALAGWYAGYIAGQPPAVPSLAITAEAGLTGLNAPSVGDITTTGANQLIVVVAPHVGTTGMSYPTSVVATGAGSLTFTQIVNNTDSSSNGYAGIWAAWASAAGTYSITVTYAANYNRHWGAAVALSGTKDCSADVTTCFGATGFQNQTTANAPMTFTLNGNTAGSYVFMAGMDYNQYTNRTDLLSNTQRIYYSTEGDDGAGDTYAMWRSNAPVSAGSVTLGDTVSTNSLYWFAAAEVLSGP